MINIIKSDLYRFFHTKAIWVLMIIMFFGTISTMSINFLMEEKYGKSESSEQYEDSEEEILVEANENNSVSIGYSGDAADESTTFVESLLIDTQSCVFLLFITIGVAIFVFAEEKDGYIKNIAGQVKHKSYLYISDMICVTLYSVLTFIIFELPAYIMLKIRYNMKFMHKGEE